MYLFYVYDYFACEYVCKIYMPGVHGGQRRALDPMGLVLQMVVSCQVRIKSGSSARATRPLNCLSSRLSPYRNIFHQKYF